MNKRETFNEGYYDAVQLMKIHFHPEYGLRERLPQDLMYTNNQYLGGFVQGYHEMLNKIHKDRFPRATYIKWDYGLKKYLVYY